MVNENTRYLLTMPFTEDKELSIFHSFDFENDGERNPFDMSLNLFDDTNPLLQFVIHNIKPRKVSSDLSSELTSRSISVSKEVFNDSPYEDEICYPYHKIGGLPYFNKVFDSGVYEATNFWINDGFLHLLQLAFPVGPDDGDIDGDWPFGEYVLNVFFRPMKNKNRFMFKYVWG